MKQCKKEARATGIAPNDKHNSTKTAPIGYHFQEEIAPVIRAYTAFEAVVVFSGMLAIAVADCALLEAANSKLEDEVIFLKRYTACVEHQLQLLTKQVLSHTAEINAVAHDVVARFGAGFEEADVVFEDTAAYLADYTAARTAERNCHAKQCNHQQ